MKRKSVLPNFQNITQFCKVILLGMMVLGVIFSLNEFKLSRFFPIKVVRIYGIHHLDHQDIQNVLLPLVEQGFFAINVENIRDRLTQLPWVANSFVRRSWPDQLEIFIKEKTVLGLWNDRNLLSDAGELFFPDQETYPDFLPRLIGPDGMQMEMIHYFKAIDQLLKPIHVKIASLELTSASAWKVILTNGIILYIGHKDVLTRLSHFVKVYPKIIGDHAIDVEYIDLRYSNGVAVRWKPGDLTRMAGKNKYGKETK